MTRTRHGLLALVLLASACTRDPLPGVGAPPDGNGAFADLALFHDLVAPPASPDLANPYPACRIVTLHYAPAAANLQLVVWIEDAAGHYVDTAFVTRLTGQYGLANRPGNALFKTDFKWPFGRREMVAPVWAHHRNHHYPKITMGGICGYSMDTLCPDGSRCSGDCDDDCMCGYHARVSSPEPFYCSPTGASPVDAMSCASRGTFPKGAYLPAPVFSLYPPRADLTQFDDTRDSPDARDFAKQNDLVAVSGATSAAGKPIDPPLYWFPKTSRDGDYVAWIEMSQESDFNPSHNHPNYGGDSASWTFEGHSFLGQPSIVYRVPFHLGGKGGTFTTRDYAGYGAWDGADGTLRSPDGTITTGKPGSGAGRLLDVTDGTGTWRLRVESGACAG